MKRLFWFFTLMVLTNMAIAQRHATGLILDDAKLRSIRQFPNQINMQKADNLALAVSLKNYCPTPGDQGAIGSCVGWASAYGAMTICRAVQENITDKATLNRIAHSAMYVYSKIKKKPNCEAGSTLSDAIDLMKNEGVCRAATFDNVPTNCRVLPPPIAVAEAANFKIKDFSSAFKFDDSPTQIVARVRQLIAQRNPIMVGVKVYESFFTAEGVKVWSPKPNEGMIDGGHAMVVVGYDAVNKRIELMNSWGTKWGDGGFISMSYDDFAKIVLFGFVITLEERQTINMTGTFAFRHPITPDNGGDARFIDAQAQYNAAKKRYELTRKDWKAGEAIFQIAAANVAKGKYVYVFSMDAAGKAEMHFPLNTKDYVSFMPGAASEIILPDPNNALLLSVKGEDNLCILYADKEIPNFSERFNKFKNLSGNFNDRLTAAFGDVLIAEGKVHYAPKAMQFDCQMREGEGSAVVPIVLAVEAQ